MSNHIKAKFCWAGIGTMAIVFLGSTLSISSQAQTTGKHAKELFDKRVRIPKVQLKLKDFRYNSCNADWAT